MIRRSLLIRLFCTLLLLGPAPAMAAGGVREAVASSAAGDPATVLGLIPHRALYEVNMVGAKNGSQIIDISGKMFFEWKPSCEGWITNHRFTLRYDYADSAPMTIGSDFSTFEGFDGKSLDFSSRRKKDGEIYEELRGKARLDAKNGDSKAIYSMPDGLTFDLGKNVIFPTMHTVSLVRKARQGSGFMKTVIFDGSDEEGPVEINTFVGKPFQKIEKISLRQDSRFKPASAGVIDDTLLGPGWKVQMAFFPLLNAEAVSDYELSMNFHENGIISDMVIEYGDFTVSQKLVALEKVSADICKH